MSVYRAGRHIALHCYARLFSKAVSLISSKSPSPAFRWKIWSRNEC